MLPRTLDLLEAFKSLPTEEQKKYSRSYSLPQKKSLTCLLSLMARAEMRLAFAKNSISKLKKR